MENFKKQFKLFDVVHTCIALFIWWIPFIACICIILFYIISVSKHCKLSMRALEFEYCIMYDSVLISINIYGVDSLFFVCIAVHESAHQQMTVLQDINFSHLKEISWKYILGNDKCIFKGWCKTPSMVSQHCYWHDVIISRAVMILHFEQLKRY